MHSILTHINHRILAITIAGVLLLGVSSVTADHDHNEARKLKTEGEILPLEQVINKARKLRPGRILEVELEHEDGRYSYQLELLGAGGSVWELEFDARSGELIKQEKEE